MKKNIILTLSFVQLIFTALPLVAQVLKYDTEITIGTKGQKITEKIIRATIHNRQQLDFADIEIIHQPTDKLHVNYARILDMEGNVLRKIKKKDIDSRSYYESSSLYSDYLLSSFKLYWNQFPYQIEYSYTITEDNYIIIHNWKPNFSHKTAVSSSSLTLNLPENYKFSTAENGNFSKSETRENGLKTIRWKHLNLFPVEQETYAPPVSERLPSVLIAPESFQYGYKGSNASWNDFGKWINSLNSNLDQLTVSEKIQIDKLTQGMDDKREIIKVLYHYLQDNTAYVDVHIDIGGLKSYPASYVCKNKYGDCKALTTYMKAMLKYAGIESYYTLVKAGENAPRINPEMAAQQFNHVVLTIPVDGDTLWLENTSNALPFNYLGTFTQNRYALQCSEQGGVLIRTPELKMDDVREQKTYTFQADATEGWTCDVSAVFRGDALENARYNYLSHNSEDQDNFIFNTMGFNGFELIEWSAVDYHRDSTYIIIQAKGLSKSPLRKLGKLTLLQPIMTTLPELEKPKERKSGIRINFPINKSTNINYQGIYSESSIIELPEKTDIKSKFGDYSTELKIVNSQIQFIESYRLYAGDYPLSDYPEFYNFIESIRTVQKKLAAVIK